jgi:hypothetical protein
VIELNEEQENRIAFWEGRVSGVMALGLAYFLIVTPVTQSSRLDPSKPFVDSIPAFIATVGLAVGMSACRRGSFYTIIIASCAMCVHILVVLERVYTLTKYW